MRYGPAYKVSTRQRILDAAARLLPVQGFEALTIDRLMLEAGLTRGAFYAYFGSKSELIAAALEGALTPEAGFPAKPEDSDAPADAAPGAPHESTPEAGAELRGPAVDSGWSLVLLAIEAARSEPAVRDSFTHMLTSLAERVTATMRGGIEDPRCTALVALALHAGASALAHAVSDDALAQIIRKASAKLTFETLSQGC